jgi:hypothetical protein
MNLSYTAEIKIGYITSEEIANVIGEFYDYIKDETLTIEMVNGPLEGCKYAKEWVIERDPITISICDETLS